MHSKKSQNTVISKNRNGFKIPKKKEISKFAVDHFLNERKYDSVAKLSEYLFEKDMDASSKALIENTCRTRLYDRAHPIISNVEQDAFGISQRLRNNYEIWEFIGDSMLQGMFARWMSSIWPTSILFQVDQGESILTTFRTEHLATKPLAAACRRMGLAYFVLTMSEEWHLIEKVHEDVFEAWVGVCCQVYGFDKTYIVVKKYLFDHLHLKTDFSEAVSAKLRLNNISKVLYRRDLFSSQDETVQQTICWLEVLPQLRGRGTGETLKDSDEAAANNLWTSLKSLKSDDELYRQLCIQRPYWEDKLTPEPWKRFAAMAQRSRDIDERFEEGECE